MPICAVSPHQEIKGFDPCQILSQTGSLETAVHKDRSGRGSCTPSPSLADITEAGHLPLGTCRTGQGRGRGVRSWDQVGPKGLEIQLRSGVRQAGKRRAAWGSRDCGAPELTPRQTEGVVATQLQPARPCGKQCVLWPELLIFQERLEIWLLMRNLTI